MMQKYRIYRPGDGFLVGEFDNKGKAQAIAHALDMNVFKSQKAYEQARDTGALHQVREINNGKEAG